MSGVEKDVIDAMCKSIDKDIANFKQKESEEGKRVAKHIEDLYANDKSNLKDINDLLLKTTTMVNALQDKVDELKLNVEKKVSKINVKMALLATGSAGLSAVLTKLTGG